MSKLIKELDPEEREYLLSWRFQARDNQLPPDEWGNDGCFIWNVRTGRGWGKTRTAAETFIYLIRYCGYKYANIAGATAEDVRSLMVEGKSGLLNCSPANFKPIYKATKRELHWPNGAITKVYYGSQPDVARGPESDLLWCDELAKWQYPEETFDNLLLGLRLGQDPRCIISSTPKPTKFLMDLEKREDDQGRKCTVVTRGNTKENYSNLSPVFISTVISKYEGTRLGRQELAGEFLDDNPDALWNRKIIDDNRVRTHPDFVYVVVGVDPAVTSKKTSNDTGIIVAARGVDGDAYVLGDYTIHGTPKEWGEAVITAFNLHEANVVVGEVNNGGDLVERNIQVIDPTVPFEDVHASRGKYVRAEPVSSLYEQGYVHHLGFFGDLESQQCDWVPGDESPDRIDALVWAITKLNILKFKDVGGTESYSDDVGFGYLPDTPDPYAEY